MIKPLTGIAIALISGVTLIALISCGPREQKGDDAFERVKAEKLLSNDSNLVNKAMAQEPKRQEPVKKTEPVDEWTKFETEIEKKILMNENAIKAIRAIPNAKEQLLRKVVKLEQENNELNTQMDAYNEAVKLRWANFKAQMNHDVNEIGNTLENLSESNKK